MKFYYQPVYNVTIPGPWREIELVTKTLPSQNVMDRMGATATPDTLECVQIGETVYYPDHLHQWTEDQGFALINQNCPLMPRL